MALILAVDLGGSGLKAAVFDPDGALRVTTTIPLGFTEDGDRSEANPAAWEAALATAVEILAPMAPVAAVAITGFTRTQVLLDAAGAVVHPAFGFGDRRAGATASALLARPEVRAHPEAARLDAFHPLARLAWLAEAEPEAWARTGLVLEPKDFLGLRLTGMAATDAIASARLLAATEGAPSLATRAGLTVPPLPPVLAPGAVLGRVRADLEGPLAALTGAVVAVVSHDSWAAVLGLGALRPGAAYTVAGSTEVVGLFGAAPAAAPGLMTVRWGDGLWHLGGPTLAGGDTLAWIAGLFGADLDTLLEDRSFAPLLFHPYLRGERVPHWDDRLRAAFTGLDARHRPGDLAHAVLEGLALAARDILERSEAAVGATAAEVRVAGGSGRNRHWLRARADILQRPLLVFRDDEAGLRGCLACARLALGLDPDLATAAARVVPAPDRVLPDLARAARSAALLRLFQDGLPAVRATAHGLLGLPG